METKFMSYFQSDPIRYGHAVLVKDSLEVYEAKWFIKKTPLHKVLERDHYIVYRYRDLKDRHVVVMNKALDKLVGNIYSFKRIFLQALDHIFYTNYFTKLDKNTKSQVCSSLVAWAYYVATRTKFNGVDWKSCDPDDIDDNGLAHKDKWLVIGEK